MLSAASEGLDAEQEKGGNIYMPPSDLPVHVSVPSPFCGAVRRVPLQCARGVALAAKDM